MKNWGWYRNDYIIHGVSSFSYQTRVPIKIPHIGKSVTSITKEQNHRHRFHIPTGSSHTYLR